MKRNLLLLMALFFFVCTGRDRAEGTYETVRIRPFNFSVQCWTFRKFTFMETLNKVEALGIHYLEAYPGQRFSKEDGDLVFDHTLDTTHIKMVKEALKKHNIALVAYGVVGFGNTEEEMKKVFSFARTMGIGVVVTEPQYDDYSLLERMAEEYNLKIAIHNHPTPNKYANPKTVLEHVKGLDPRIGDCCDTGHWMRSGFDPVESLRLLQGRIIHLHMKDLDKFGDKEAVDVPFGEGKGRIHDVLAELTRQDYHGFISIEHENPADADDPSGPIKEGLKNVEKMTYFSGYEQILPYQWGAYRKTGWNHYGPGYFELDPETGVLKSQGGMGLFWFRKKYKDFVLELDYKCSRITTNSGVFLRVPEVPVSDDYIYHALEVQIDDASSGIHQTGAAYDAEAPLAKAFTEPGHWNHFKIVFKGTRLKVELNGVTVLDWGAEPRGKVRDLFPEGYVGLQNHDSISPVYFKNIFIKEL